MNCKKITRFQVFFFVYLLFLGQSVLAETKSELNFVENKNQWDKQILFKMDIQSGHIYFTGDEFHYVYYNGADLEKVHDIKHEDYFEAYNTKINCYAYNLHFLNANKNLEVMPSSKQTYYHNYFIGNDASKWAGNVGVYEHLTYKNLYPGIDIAAYGVEKSFKYDIIVHPQSNLSSLQFQYEGIKPVLLSNGNLKMDIGFNTIQETAPYTYQVINGEKVVVKSNYVLSKKGELSFEFPDGYNKAYDLIIDPTLVFATYSGSTATTYGFSATYDLAGSLYAGGECFNVGWGVSLGAFQITFGGGVDAGINKYNPTGSGIVYSTYFGGSASDLPNNMVVNSNFELAITGSTASPNLPTTAGCYDNALNGTRDAYVVHFNASGTALIGSTYIGGSGVDAVNLGSLSPNYGDANRGEIFSDNNGDFVIAISTQSSDFPTTPGAFQTTYGGGTQDGCIFKVNSTCSNLIFSTYLGGNLEDAAFSITKNSIGNWVICGGTKSPNFPTTPGSITPVQPGGTDAFACILNNSATSLVNSTYIGTTLYDHGFKIQVDPMDTIYVCGQTNTASTFPVSPGVYTNPASTIFIQKLTPNLGATVLSTRIGQTTNLVPTAFLKDNCGGVYFAGFQAGANLPLTTNAYQTTQGGFWLSVLSGDFVNLVYATYMGASGDHVDGGTSRFDPQGIVYHSVCTISSTQYQSPGCYTPTNLASSWDVASFKFNFELSGVIADLTIPKDSGCVPFTVAFTNNSLSATSYKWYFGDGDSSLLAAPTHTYTTVGTYTVTLIAYNSNTCIPSDTAYTIIKVIQSVDASFTSEIILGCIDDTVLVSLTDTNQNASFFWAYGNGSSSTLEQDTVIYTTQGTYTITCYASNGFCHDTSQFVANLSHPISSDFTAQDSICINAQLFPITSTSTPAGFVTHLWDMGDGTTYNTGITPILGTPLYANHLYTKGGTYLITLVISDSLGCKDTSSRTIFVDNLAYADFTASDTNICVGEPIFFKDTVAPGSTLFQWDLGDGSIVSNQHNPYYSWTKGGVYNVTLTSYYLTCPDTSVTKTIVVNDFPNINLGKDTSICAGLTGSIFLADLNNPGAFYQWSTGETSNGITVTEPGHYWLRASNGECVTTDSIWIKRDCYINIPNSFSPNGDGLNEYFFPRELLSSGVRSFTMNIFNRWGENIFTTSKIDGRGWDGKYNGVPQNVGVYVYMIEVTFINNVRKTFNGNVTLLR